MLHLNYVIAALLSFDVLVRGDVHNEQQIGDSNYEAELEDVSFLIFYDGVPGDYDYSYDYSDLTVKPEEDTNPTTEKISTPKPEAMATNSTTLSVLTTKKPNTELPLNSENFQIPVVVVTEGTKLKKGYVSSSTLRKKQGPAVVETESLPKRTCLHGFVLDEKNRCKKQIRKSTLNARSPKPPLPHGLRYPQLKESQ